jgi:hypothetical protein
MAGQPHEAPIARGVARVLYAYEIGQLIDLDESERRITSLTERATIKHKRRAPKYFEYQPAPLHVSQACEPIPLGDYCTAANVDAVLFDFGAISVNYAVPLSNRLTDLVDLSAALYDDTALLADSRRRVADLLAVVGPAVVRSHIDDVPESYVIFQLEEVTDAQPSEEFLRAYGPLLARILRAEHQSLSPQEISDAIARRIAFGEADLTLIDGDAAIVIDRDAEDTIAVLEFANVELLEMRFLDRQLDRALDQAYRALSRQGWRQILRPGARRNEVDRIARMQMDSALLFEGVNNAFKLVGDQFLVRLYRLASERLHLAEWDASILRKLQTLDGIYSKFSELAANRRLEVLEWIVIILIGSEIVLSLTRR